MATDGRRVAGLVSIVLIATYLPIFASQFTKVQGKFKFGLLVLTSLSELIKVVVYAVNVAMTHRSDVLTHHTPVRVGDALRLLPLALLNVMSGIILYMVAEATDAGITALIYICYIGWHVLLELKPHRPAIKLLSSAVVVATSVYGPMLVINNSHHFQVYAVYWPAFAVVFILPIAVAVATHRLNLSFVSQTQEGPAHALILAAESLVIAAAGALFYEGSFTARALFSGFTIPVWIFAITRVACEVTLLNVIRRFGHEAPILFWGRALGVPVICLLSAAISPAPLTSGLMGGAALIIGGVMQHGVVLHRVE